MRSAPDAATFTADGLQPVVRARARGLRTPKRTDRTSRTVSILKRLRCAVKLSGMPRHPRQLCESRCLYRVPFGHSSRIRMLNPVKIECQQFDGSILPFFLQANRRGGLQKHAAANRPSLIRFT